MNKFLIGLAFILPFSFGVKYQDVNYRPYISTRMAKILMEQDAKPDDENVEELCDGSGWITHGDGHKTECPGCSACNSNTPEESTPTVEPLQQDIKKKRIFQIPFDLFRRARVFHLSFWSEMVWPMRENETTNLGERESQRSYR
jgi:hypothetical protein